MLVGGGCHLHYCFSFMKYRKFENNAVRLEDGEKLLKRRKVQCILHRAENYHVKAGHDKILNKKKRNKKNKMNNKSRKNVNKNKNNVNKRKKKTEEEK